MKKIYKKLAGWADAFTFGSVALFVLSFIGWIMNSAWTGDVFAGAFYLLVLSPIFRGFSVLVQNAEEQIAERKMVGFLPFEDEEE